MVRIELKPSEVYRVPLTWLMQGSLVNVSLIKKLNDNITDSKDKVDIFEDIARKFCKTAADHEEPDFLADLKS